MNAVPRVIELARSTKRHEPKPNPLNEELRGRLCVLAEKEKRFGAQGHQLLREGYSINHKRTERLYKLEGLSLRRKKKRKRFKSETRAPLADPAKPNQYWAMDFVSDQLVHGGRFRGLTLRFPCRTMVI